MARLYTNLFEVVKKASRNQLKYFVTFIDGCTGYVMLKLKIFKKQPASAVKSMIDDSENLCDSLVKRHCVFNLGRVIGRDSDEKLNTSIHNF